MQPSGDQQALGNDPITGHYVGFTTGVVSKQREIIPYRVCGNFPFKDLVAGNFPALGKFKRWLAEVYPLLDNPKNCGMAAQDNCIHPDLHSLFREILKTEALTRGESVYYTLPNEETLYKAVDAFINYDEGQITVELRPKEGQEELTLRAMDLLKAYGFKEDQIQFIEESNFNCLANLGMHHKVKILAINNAQEVSKYLESHTIHSEAGVNYLYRQGIGIRYITPDEIKSLQFSIDDPAGLKAKVDEIARFIAEDRSAISKRHADFLIIKNHAVSDPGKAFRQEFTDLAEFIKSIPEDKWVENTAEISLRLSMFYTNFSGRTDEFFRNDSPHDPQWAFFIARILVGQTYNGKGLDLGKHLLGGTHSLPGGMIGYYDQQGKLHFGPQIFDSIAEVLDQYPQLGKINGQNCNQLRNNKPIILSPTEKEDSAIVFSPVKDLHSVSKIVVKKYIFHPDTEQRVKDLMNLALEDNENLTNSFVSQINITRDRRDPEPDLIQLFGANSHNVFVLGTTEGIGADRKISYTRYEKLGYGLEQLLANTVDGRTLSEKAARNISEVHLQFKLLQALGLSTEFFPQGPGVPLLTPCILTGKGDSYEEYIKRVFLLGEPIHTIERLQGGQTTLTLQFADELGLLAAHDIMTRRRNYRDGDEIVERIEREIIMRLMSARSAFPPPSRIPRDDPYGSSINLISSHLAADLAVCRWVERGFPPSNEIHFSDQYLDTFIDSIQTHLRIIKETLAKNGDRFLKVINNEFDFKKLDLMKKEFGANSPVVEIMDFPACFERSVSDMRKADIGEICDSLVRSIESLADFYGTVIKGIESGTQVDQLLKHTEALFGSNSWYTDLPINHPLLRAPIERDSNWGSYGSSDRLQLISTLRVSAWMKKMRLATNNDNLDLQEIAASARSLKFSPLKRHEAIRRFSENLTARSPQISLSTDTISYFYDGLTSRRFGMDRLEKMGYLFY